MTIPTESIDVPDRVRMLAGGAALTPVWRNNLDGLTFHAVSAGGADSDRYIKWAPRNNESSLADEAVRLRWAAPFIRVPEVLVEGGDATHEWMVTAALPGESAVAPRWVADAATAVRAIGEGLRAMHEALPVGDCPFEWSVSSRIANAESRGIRLPFPLQEPPPIDRLVVCHGDACAPNTLIGEDGRWLAHVDLGQLGTGDRWADIAVASMSTEWNYGPGWEDALIDAYGVQPDRPRLAYYRELWNAT